MAAIGWLLSYAYVLGPPMIGIANCTHGSDDPWVICLIVSLPLLLIGLLLVWFARPWVRWQRWLALPQALTAVLACVSIAPFFRGSTIQGRHVCQVQTGYFQELSPAWWHGLWAPFQLAGIVFLMTTIVFTWRATARRTIKHAE